MKYIKLMIIAAFLSTMFTGCSYVSDMVEGAITDRASFGATAVKSGTSVIVTWDKIDSSGEFAGIEIYRTSRANDEYASYTLVASRDINNNGNYGSLLNATTVQYEHTSPPSGGVYFYRVGIIHWVDDVDKSNYNSQTDINAISGYAKILLP